MNWWTAICNATAEFFKWKNNPWRIEREKAALEQERQEKAQALADAIEREVREHDADAVNRRLQDALRMVWLTTALAAALLAVHGCAGRTVYVNEPDRAYPMERNGVLGWWVPDGEMSKKLKLLEEAKP